MPDARSGAISATIAKEATALNVKRTTDSRIEITNLIINKIPTLDYCKHHKDVITILTTSINKLLSR